MIDQVRGWIDASARVVVLSGAGISTDSGIPDFRGPQGVWTKDPLAEKLSNIHYYLADPEVRRRAWKSRIASPAWDAKPNAGHLAIVELERRGKLHALITQNIDELHQRAGNSPDRVIEVHGSMRRFMCWGCGMRGPMEEALERVRSGEEDPACRDCGGILKSDTISFGQALVPEVIDRALQAAAEADFFLAVGTSLQVYPVAGAVEIARRAGARVVIVNAEPTPFDAIADAVLDGSISEVLPAITSGRESASRFRH
ncbi:MAG: NAD-dependent deacylase [Betaproteobacteria bacterium]|nr:NAD-dependent deacylase [Betaproteobacteria bacterium]